MELITELFKQGVMGVVAGIFLYLFLMERRAREKERKEYTNLLKTLEERSRREQRPKGD
mgnify:CR=1 FL=1